jgi:hypothetical protein
MRQREMRIRSGKTGDATGQPSWRLSFLGNAGANFSVPAAMF